MRLWPNYRRDLSIRNNCWRSTYLNYSVSAVRWTVQCLTVNHVALNSGNVVLTDKLIEDLSFRTSRYPRNPPSLAKALPS